MNQLGAYKKELVLLLSEVITFGTAAVPLLLTAQQRWHALAAVVTIVLGVVATARTLYNTLTGSAVQAAMTARSAHPRTEPGEPTLTP